MERVESLAKAARGPLSSAAQRSLLAQGVNVSRATAQLRPKAGGLQAGRSWHDMHEPGKDILELFNETLGVLPKTEINNIESRIKVLAQAMSLVMPSGHSTLLLERWNVGRWRIFGREPFGFSRARFWWTVGRWSQLGREPSVLWTQAMESVKSMKAMYRSVLPEPDVEVPSLKAHMDAGRTVLNKGYTTRLECQIGRILTKGKNKKAALQKAKAEYEACSMSDPAKKVFHALWELADAELQ